MTHVVAPQRAEASARSFALAYRSYRYPHIGYRIAPTMRAPVTTAPICVLVSRNVAMMSVVRGPIRSLSDWWRSMKTKKTPTTTQRFPDPLLGLALMHPPRTVAGSVARDEPHFASGERGTPPRLG